MITLGPATRFYLALGATDLRKSIDSLAALVVDVLHQDPGSAQILAFGNRGRDKLKLLVWLRIAESRVSACAWLRPPAAWQSSPPHP